MSRIAYQCDGCGKRVEAFTGEELDALAVDWLTTERDWSSKTWLWASGITACGADCVTAAKKHVLEYAHQSLIKYADRIESSKLSRIGK